MERKKLGNEGFSLVELIIVVAIMAILAAALAPQVIKYIAKSKADMCEHNMGLIREAVAAEITEKEKSYDKYGLITDLDTVELYDGTSCPDKGTYSVDVKPLDDDGYEIIVKCTKHGEFNKDNN